MLKKLLLLSFIEGAAVMAAELCGAKLLAPIFGSSLYVWASVMGITLAALAAGYFFGGRLSQKAERSGSILFSVLMIAALFLLLMPVLAHYVLPRISYLPFLPGVVLSTLLLLFPPVFLLGASSPLFITAQTLQGASAGHVSGTVYAISTAGGIFATFFCGFYLIPEAGLNVSLLCFGGILLLADCLVFKRLNPFHFFLAAVPVYLVLQLSFRKNNCQLISDSILGRLEVKEYPDAKKNVCRVLTVNDIVQTEMDPGTRKSLSAYVKLVDTLIPVAAPHEKALVLGLGGGLIANLLTEKKYATDGVDLDQRMIEVARKYFYLNKQVATFAEDARYFLNRCPGKYAIVVVDIFKGEEHPSHILTKESLLQLRQKLEGASLLLINWHGYTNAVNGQGTSVLQNTLQSAGYSVKLCAVSAQQDYRNLIVVASPEPLAHLPYELSEDLQSTTYINTDDRPLLELYNAKANKAWRLNYLRYYQQQPIAIP